jgi:glyoxylase-like metal-dependent hydrolase (beta-lactamase superfamily II)
LGDGERISLAGDPGWQLECLHTPGHDPGHLALLEGSTQTLIAADLLANPGTIVISPEWDGDMTDYLNSLERCAALDFSLLIPGHGMPYFGPAGAEALRDLVTHRLAREQRIRDALDQGATTMDEILNVAYSDVDQSAWPLAKHQIRAHLPRLGVDLPRSVGN